MLSPLGRVDSARVKRSPRSAAVGGAASRSKALSNQLPGGGGGGGGWRLGPRKSCRVRCWLLCVVGVRCFARPLERHVEFWVLDEGALVFCWSIFDKNGHEEWAVSRLILRFLSQYCHLWPRLVSSWVSAYCATVLAPCPRVLHFYVWCHILSPRHV